ncbi:TPA: co-chaperone GroES [Candidatus Dependentiae bacterium]|nr:MAG: 10 kDa chaperonin [candidate division TM6 bacterium GW2011_GWE2_31_21]KKP53179.1 MAG: 10 kDa chaperonin [candidate division TM6 bacterium GW2011_GWF2_33_332]HBS47997.1 co-chaperone GroES [Candidatus Dependentiae bacterium]HBZ73399.1 co-chaperone GroES [Candidatus Dependentiae bacterium]
MAKKISPLYDRVLVQRIEDEETTSSGIIIPDTAKEKTQIAEVKAIGNGKITNDGSIKALTVKVGDKIIFGKYSGTEIKLEGQEYLILKEEEILGIVS